MKSQHEVSRSVILFLRVNETKTYLTTMAAYVRTRYNFHAQSAERPIAVAARSKARTVFVRSNTEIVFSNPTGGMDVCVRSVCVYSVYPV
jgi:hypothetical protein